MQIMSAFFQAVTQLQHSSQQPRPHIVTGSKRGSDLIVAATASDDHLAGGIDYLIVHAQYDQLETALHFPSVFIHVSSDRIWSHDATTLR
jgi:hypothetical protein